MLAGSCLSERETCAIVKNLSSGTKITSQRKNTTAQKLLNPLSVFSPQSRDELNSAIDDCLGVSPESNRTVRLHGPIGQWDVTQVTDMSKLFNIKDTFNYDLSNWDVSRVTDMCAMFSHAKSFNQDLSKWDVSRVFNMQEMFENANSFNQTLCGAAWVNSNASKIEMFDFSPGRISDKVCGVCMLW